MNIKDTWTKPRGRVEVGEGGGFSWGGVEGWGEKAYNCNWITIKIFKKSKWRKKLERIFWRMLKFSENSFFAILNFPQHASIQGKSKSWFYSDDTAFQRGTKWHCIDNDEFCLVLVVGRIMALKDVHILIPLTCEYTGKKDFTDGIKLLFRDEDYPGLPRWVQGTQRSL